MKKILFSIVLLITAILGVSVINAEEVATEEEVVRTVREEIIINAEESTHDYSDYELLKDEETEFYYEDFSQIDIDTLNVYIDGMRVVDDGYSVNEDFIIRRYDTEEYKNYSKLISIVGSVENSAGEITALYQIEISKNGNGSFYKFDTATEKYVESELRMTFEAYVIDDGFMPINGEEIESWIANALENHLGWFLAILGISAATVAGAIVGMVKLVAYYKATQIGIETIKKSVDNTTNKVSTLGKQVGNITKSSALNVYTAEAISEIIDSSSNQRIANRRDELKRKYIKALNSKDLSEEEAEQVKKEFEQEFLKKNLTDKDKARTNQDDIDEIVKKIKG